MLGGQIKEIDFEKLSEKLINLLEVTPYKKQGERTIAKYEEIITNKIENVE